MLRDKAKLVLRLKTDAYNEEIDMLINAAVLDLGIAGITQEMPDDPLIVRAVLLYVKLNFGDLDKDEYDRLQDAYNTIKAQLRHSSRYRRREGDPVEAQ